MLQCEDCKTLYFQPFAETLKAKGLEGCPACHSGPLKDVRVNVMRVDPGLQVMYLRACPGCVNTPPGEDHHEQCPEYEPDTRRIEGSIDRHHEPGDEIAETR